MIQALSKYQAILMATATVLVALKPGLGKPNIIMIYSDDQKRGTIHALGNAIIHTPNLDRMVKEGTSFRNCVIAGADRAAVCVPSRAMLLSGKTLYHSGGGTIKGVTMPQNLKNRGYATWHFGKWHNDRASQVRSFTGGMPLPA